MAPSSETRRRGSYSRHPRRAHPARGFTLIEVIVALLITAGIAAAGATAVSSVLRAQEVARARQEALSRAALAADLIAQDAQNLVRSGDLYDARVLLVNGALASGAQRDELLLFSHALRPIRAGSDENEGGVYEVQYRLESPLGPDAAGYVLWRRADPVPDEFADAGGVAVPVVVDLRSLSIQAFDGSAWLDDWDSDRDGYPHALRISAQATDSASRREATVRRTIAIDRTPIPYAGTQSQSDSGGGGAP